MRPLTELLMINMKVLTTGELVAHYPKLMLSFTHGLFLSKPLFESGFHHIEKWIKHGP